MKAAERKRRKKTNLVKYVFTKWRETLPYVLTSSQTIYLTNLDGAADRLTSQSSEELIFIAPTKKLTQKCLRISKFICDNIHLNWIIIVSPDTDATVISLHQIVTNLTFLDAIWS